MPVKRPVFLAVSMLCGITAIGPALADHSKVVVAEATYVMGDSDTIAAAEEHALLRAKRQAIEEAGVYLEATSEDVETHAGGRTSHLNSLGIRTLAAAVTETDILEKRRSFEGDRLVFYVKIKAKVHLDWLTEAIKRMKADEQLAEHHRQLAAENSHLKAELERLRRQSPGGAAEGSSSARLRRNRGAAERLTRTAVQARSLPAKVESTTRAIEEDDSYVDAYVVRGQTFLRIAAPAAAGKTLRAEEKPLYVERAIADFTQALTLDPGSTWALLGRGDAYALQARTEEAAADYERILTLDPLFDVARQRLITLFTGLAKRQAAAGQWQPALASLSHILEPQATITWLAYQKEAYLLRSDILTQLGDLDRAVADLSTVLRVDPGNFRALMRRAELYRRLKQGRLAREDLDRACGLALEEACASPR
jgi:tetratricopeptide (TPR) repeat protein